MQWFNSVFLKFIGFVTGIGLVITPWLNPFFYHQNPQTNPSQVVGNLLTDRRIWPAIWWKYAPNETPPPWKPYSIPSDSRQFSSLQTIPVVPVNADCPQTGRQTVEAKLYEAFIVTDPLDTQFLVSNQHTYASPENELHYTYRNLFGGIPYGRFLVIQEFARNIGSPDQGTSGLVYTAIATSSDQTKRLPLHFDGGYPLFGWESRPFWYVFPVRSDENDFIVYFCDQERPEIRTIHLIGSGVQAVRGAYSFIFGLYIP